MSYSGLDNRIEELASIRIHPFHCFKAALKYSTKLEKYCKIILLANNYFRSHETENTNFRSRDCYKAIYGTKRQVKTSNSSYGTHKTMTKNEMLHSNLGPNGQNPLFNALNNEHYNLWSQFYFFPRVNLDVQNFYDGCLFVTVLFAYIYCVSKLFLSIVIDYWMTLRLKSRGHAIFWENY